MGSVGLLAFAGICWWLIPRYPAPISVRGFLSGTIGKKMGLTVTSTKAEDGERTYSAIV